MRIGVRFILLCFPYSTLDRKAKMEGINPYYNKRTGSNPFLIDSKDSLIDTSSYSIVYVRHTDRCHLLSVLIANSFQFVINWKEFELSLLLILPLPSFLNSS